MRWNHYVSYFFGRGLSRERGAAFCERDYGASVPESLCFSAWPGALFRNGECPLGRVQSGDRLLARLPRRTI
jgi:hypothetical protein